MLAPPASLPMRANLFAGQTGEFCAKDHYRHS